jgi:hypothetical protein
MGFVLIGNKWLTTPRNIVVDANGEDSVADGDNGVSAVRSAVTDWNGHAGNLVTTSTSGSPPVGLSDGTSVMIFGDPYRICTGGCLGVTTTGVTTGNTMETNGIVFEEYADSDIFFNDRTNFTSAGESDGCISSPPKKAEYSLEAVAVHEVGHLLGLGHSGVGSATMYSSIGACDAGPASLHADDIAGIECIYKEGSSCGTGPCSENQVTASTATNCRNKGRDALTVDVAVESNCGPKAGVDVTVTLSSACGQQLSGTAATGSDGVVRFRLGKSDAQTGVYDIDVTVDDPKWNGLGDTSTCFVTNAATTCQ